MAAQSKQDSHALWPAGFRKLAAPCGLPNQSHVLSLPCDNEGAVGLICPSHCRQGHRQAGHSLHPGMGFWISVPVSLPRASYIFGNIIPHGHLTGKTFSLQDLWEKLENHLHNFNQKSTYVSDENVLLCFKYLWEFVFGVFFSNAFHFPHVIH